MKEVTFAIHDFNQRGGQDRSTLEIVQHLSRKHPVALHAFTLEADRPNANMHFRPVRPWLRRPVLFKSIIYHGVTLFRFLRPRRGPICATGACSLLSDVVHVQFVHAAWRREREPLSLYGRVVGFYNLLTEKIAFRPAKTYIAISEAVKRDLEREYGLPNVEVVHHGVNTKRFFPASAEEKQSLRRELKLPEGVTLLLFVGTFERKGLGVILAALAQLPPELRSKWRLLAVGAGDRARYEQKAAELGLGGQVEIRGPQSGIERYFRAADVFVFPSTYEPFGLVILEAMACGLATIASGCAGGAELISANESGMILENPRDPKELAGKIQTLLENGSLLAHMARAARAVAERRDWHRVAEEYEAVLAKWSAR